MNETEAAIVTILKKKKDDDPDTKAKRARTAMEKAFPESNVTDYQRYKDSIHGMPDPKDLHVVAAAIKSQAALIVTENLKHFPKEVLEPFGLEVLSADVFIANTIDLDPGRAVPVVNTMRERFKKPELSAEALLLKMEAEGLVETVLALKPYAQSI